MMRPALLAAGGATVTNSTPETSSPSIDIQVEENSPLPTSRGSAPRASASHAPPSTSTSAAARLSEILPSRPSLLGQTISERYRVDELIAKGGMGAVYRGEHVHMRKQVAIKILRPETEGFPDLVARFEREAIAGAHVDHPNVAAATDFGRMPDGAYFLILEYVKGVTLRERMKQSPLDWMEAARIARQLAAALGACHRMEILHRDLKPRNVMLEHGRADRVKLIDFGLAKVPAQPTTAPGEEEETRRSITLKGIVFGTVSYMAPETALGMDAVDARSDLYALGIVLYELLTGKHPFDAKDPSELFLCHKTMAPPPFRVRAPDRDVPPALEALTLRLLEKSPAQRYPNADAVARALDAVLPEVSSDSTFDGGSLSISTHGTRASEVRVSSFATPPPLSTAALDPVKPARPRWRVSWGVAASVAVLIIATAAAATQRARPAAPPLTARAAPRVLEVAERSVQAARATLDESRREILAARTKLRDAAEAKKWSVGGDAILALAALGRDAPRGSSLEEPDVAPAATVALGLAFTENTRSEPVLQALANEFGTIGIDVLYEISSKHGGARAANRADELLDSPAVRRRAAAPVRAALALREARCEDKAAIFERAAREGDGRALLLLERLRGSKCSAARCCYPKSEALKESIRALRQRIERD
jgi:eukaryotic-like serine/threonine-protein kinase